MTERQFYMVEKPDVHKAYAEDNSLVVYWYDFGDHAPYESGNYLIFDDANARVLAQTFGADSAGSLDEIAESVAKHFRAYFDVRVFADQRQITYEHKVDFWP